MRTGLTARLRMALMPLLVLQAIAWTCVLALDALQDALPTVREIQAQRLESPGIEDIDATAWQAHKLPIRTCRVTCPDGWVQNTVFRYTWTLPAAPDTPWAIYLRYVESSAAIHVNGRHLLTAGSMQPPLANLQYLPQFAEIPRNLLHAGENEVLIVVAEEVQGFGKLLPFHVGEAAELRRAWFWASFVNERLQPWSTAVLVIVMLIAAGIATIGRGGAVFGWFAVLAGACALANPVLWPSDPPSAPLTRWSIYYVAGFGILAAATGFMAHLAGRRPRRLEHLAIAALVVGTFATCVVLGSDIREGVLLGNRLMRIAVLVLAPLLLWRLIAAFRGHWDRASGWAYGIFSVTLAFSMHDMIASLNGGFVWLMYTHIGLTLLVVAFCIVLSQRYGHRLSHLESSNEQLMRRMRDKELELAADFDRLRALSREQILASERQRIMRDMHDGIGGRLASLLLRLKPGAPAAGDIRETLQESLTDLRLIIDSLDGAVADDPGVALGTFRARMAPGLRAQGVTLEWDVELYGLTGFGAEKTLQVYRILQEACHNVARHANATRIVVNARVRDGRLYLRIQDDGRGMGGASRDGRGLRNMRERATSLGGGLAISSGECGTLIEAWIPCGEATGAPDTSLARSS